MQEFKGNTQQDRAYLVGWVNSTIKSKFIQISSLEQLSNGVVFCELLNLLFPGKVPLSKVFIKPKGDYQIMENFKLFSSISEKVGLKTLDYPKLSKGKQSDMILLLLYIKKLMESKERGGNISHLQISNLQSSVMLYKTTSPAKSAKGSSRIKERISVSPPSRLLISQQGKLLPPLLKKMNPLQHEIDRLTHRKTQLNSKIAELLRLTSSCDETDLQRFKLTLLKSIQI